MSVLRWSRRHPGYRTTLVALACLLLVGCATAIRTIRAHPQQDRLERLLATIQPHTGHPEAYTWVRILQPTKRHVDLWVFRQRHIYLSEALVNEADDVILTALLAHGIAHHDLAHHTKRGIMRSVQYVAFLIGGAFVPGLGFGWYVADPVMEGVMSAGQEFSADAKAVTYLEKLGYSVDEYVKALEFLTSHQYVERTGGILTTQEGFSGRIAALRGRHASTDRPTNDRPQQADHPASETKEPTP